MFCEYVLAFKELIMMWVQALNSQSKWSKSVKSTKFTKQLHARDDFLAFEQDNDNVRFMTKKSVCAIFHYYTSAKADPVFYRDTVRVC